MELRFLAAYVEELKTGGLARFSAAYPHPMLVVRDVGASESEDDAAFQTKFMTRNEMFSSQSGSTALDAAEGSVVAGHVVPVRKRAGGAFADRIGLGRAPNVDVRVALSQVSKYHAYFSKQADGKWSITDAGSRNGTVVNGERLAERFPKTIEDGADIGVGPYRFTFHTEAGFLEIVKRRAGIR